LQQLLLSGRQSTFRPPEDGNGAMSAVNTRASPRGSAAEARHRGEGAGRSHGGGNQDSPEHVCDDWTYTRAPPEK